MTYEVVRRIGRGGMGVVDLARDEAGHEYALKRLSLHGTPDELARARARIRREAEVLQRLDHPGIVRLHEVLDDGDDLVLVMPYLPGGNLAQRVGDHGPMDPDQVRELAATLLDALASAHRRGVTHRDIKPANVLFDADGRAALADFGVAIHRDATPGLTATEVVVGTPGFMSPEQARGEAATAASDVFSLGATLAYAATGVGPFGTSDPRVLLLRAASGRVEKLPRTLPPDLRTLLTAMLDKDPERRPTAAAARGGPSGTEPGVGASLPRPARRRRPALFAGAAAVAVLAIGGGVVALTRSADDAKPRPRPTTTTTTSTAPCTDLPFQPCGKEPAPNTDGRTCDEGFADYDEDAANGCEAEPDALKPGATLTRSLTANLVPGDDVDTFTVPVQDNFQVLGDGTVKITLTAPAGVSMKLTVLRDGEVLGAGVSGDGEPTTVALREPSYFSDDGGELEARVEWLGSDRSAEPYTIERSGNF